MGASASKYTGEVAKKVVILGGGFGGVYAAKKLEAAGNIEVTLVTPTDYLDISWAGPRAVADPESAPRNYIDLSDVLTTTTIVSGLATAVDTSAKTVTVAGETLAYDALVVATGSDYNADDPASIMKCSTKALKTKEERVAQIQAESKKISDSKGVLIIGGGLSGIEMAGELSYYFPTLPITLVSSDETLGAKLPAAGAAAAAARILSERPKVTVICGTKATAADAEKYGCDMSYSFVGMKPNTAFLAGSGVTTNEAGFIVTGDDFAVEGVDGVFSFGDVATRPGSSGSMSGFLTAGYAPTITSNIVAYFTGGSLTKADAMPNVGFAGMGAGDGFGFKGTMAFPEFAVRMMKSPDVMRGKVHGELVKAEDPMKKVRECCA